MAKQRYLNLKGFFYPEFATKTASSALLLEVYFLLPQFFRFISSSNNRVFTKSMVKLSAYNVSNAVTNQSNDFPKVKSKCHTALFSSFFASVDFSSRITRSNARKCDSKVSLSLNFIIKRFLRRYS
jgi:hypothetical protein